MWSVTPAIKQAKSDLEKMSMDRRSGQPARQGGMFLTTLHGGLGACLPRRSGTV